MKSNRRTVEDPVITLRRSLKEAQAMVELRRKALLASEDQVARIQQAIAVLEGHNSDGITWRFAPITSIDFMPTPPQMLGAGSARMRFQFRYHEGDTQEELARRIVLRQGRPMHVMEIVTAMISAGYPNKDPFKLRQSLTTTLERRVKNKDTWTKPEPAQFGLEDWGQRDLTFPEASPEAEPPRG